jgi:hypothetical protein
MAVRTRRDDGIFGRRRAAAARHQVVFKGRRCRPIERIHHVGFSDLAQLGRALIAIGEHVKYYGESGTIAIELSGGHG